MLHVYGRCKHDKKCPKLRELGIIFKNNIFTWGSNKFSYNVRSSGPLITFVVLLHDCLFHCENNLIVPSSIPCPPSARSELFCFSKFKYGNFRDFICVKFKCVLLSRPFVTPCATENLTLLQRTQLRRDIAQVIYT